MSKNPTRRIAAAVLTAAAVLAITLGAVTVAQTAAPAPEQAAPVEAAAAQSLDWGQLERCWIDRFMSKSQRDAEVERRWGSLEARVSACGSSALEMRCDWQIAYPSRYWIEQGCGRISSWPQHFGDTWPAEGQQWVADVRAGRLP